jgi:glycosyltransferase involved in cell wall biosynthesis
MNVLLLTQVLPYPPDSGPKIKTYHVVRYLAQRHAITLVSFVRSEAEQQAAEALRKLNITVHTVPLRRTIPDEIRGLAASLMSSQPFLMTRDHRDAMASQIDRLKADTPFDIAHADQLNMAQYALRLPRARKVLDLHNALWLLYKRFWETMPNGPRKWLLGRDWRLLRRYEADMCRRFDAVLAVTDEDRQALLEATGSPVDISVLPIAIDTDALQMIARESAPRTILHIGTMYWPPNIQGVMWFAREVWPEVKAAVPDARFVIVGTRPPPEVQALSTDDPSIEVTGYVTDPTDIFRRTAAAIVPVSSGSGMRVKILEAFARGLPTVSTTIGFEGINAVPDQHLLAADDPHTYAQAVIRLLDNPDDGRRLCDNARRLVEAEYDYRSACRPLDAIYDRLGATSPTIHTVGAHTQGSS